MLLPKKNMFLPFSLIWKKLRTPRGNTVYCPIFTTLIFEAICLPTLMGFCPIDCSRLELGPLCLTRMSRRWVKSVLKGSEVSLFVDDFALCIRAKFLPHVQRLMQLCVNSVQDWASNNGFKFSTSKTVYMHFCNQRKHFAELSFLLDKNPTRVVIEAKFLSVIFD